MIKYFFLKFCNSSSSNYINQDTLGGMLPFAVTFNVFSVGVFLYPACGSHFNPAVINGYRRESKFKKCKIEYEKLNLFNAFTIYWGKRYDD